MKKMVMLIGLVVLAACVGSGPAYAACPPTCSCQASYNGGICRADYGPCPNGTCASCTCSSENGCVGGCFPKPGGGGGDGSTCISGRCPMYIDAQALTLTGLLGLLNPPPGWTVVFDDDGARRNFHGEYTLEEILRLEYGRTLFVDHGRKIIVVKQK